MKKTKQLESDLDQVTKDFETVSEDRDELKEELRRCRHVLVKANEILEKQQRFVGALEGLASRTLLPFLIIGTSLGFMWGITRCVMVTLGYLEYTPERYDRSPWANFVFSNFFGWGLAGIISGVGIGAIIWVIASFLKTLDFSFLSKLLPQDHRYENTLVESYSHLQEASVQLERSLDFFTDLGERTPKEAFQAAQELGKAKESLRKMEVG